MKTVKDDKLSTLQNVYLFRKQYRLALTVLSGFTLDKTPELLDDSDLWDNIQDALGKKGVFDLAMPKRQGEVVVVGKCFAPGGKEVSHKEVSFRAGDIKKRAIVFGNRIWKKSGVHWTMSNPEPFLEKDISWENAFGGPKFKKNPDGKGQEDMETPSGDIVRPLPTVEDPDRLIVSTSDKPDPVGFAPLGLAWPARLKNLGTYDKKWLKEDWPGFPDDFDFGYFNVAPKDQRIEDFWTGGEEIEIENMHPETRRIRSRVPQITPRIFINLVTESGETFEEIPVKMDTIWLLPGQNTGVSIWRGETVVSDDEATQISHLVAFFEEQDEESKPLAFYQDKLKEEPEEAELEALEVEGGVKGKEGLAIPGIRATGSLAATGAATAAALGKEPGGVQEGPAEGEQVEEAGGETQKGEKSEEAESTEEAEAEEAGVEPEAGEVELTKTEESELKAELKGRGIDFDKMCDDLGISPSEPPKTTQSGVDSMGLSELNPNIWDLDPKEFDKAITEHYRKKGIDVGKIPEDKGDQSAQQLRNAHLEQIKMMKEALRKHGDAEPELLAIINEQESELSKIGETPLEEEEAAPRAEEAEPSKEEVSPAQKALQDKLAAGESLAGTDLAGADLTGMDLSGQNLQGCNLSGAVMENINLANVDLGGVILSNAILTGAILTEAKLKGAKLDKVSASGCNLAKADLSGADLSNAEFYKADLSEAKLNGAVLKEANFSEAKLSKAKCKEVQAEGAKFEGADLTGAVFQDSNLKGADLSGACIDNADFEKANLGGVRLNEVTGKAASFKDADMHESRSDDNTHINESDFSGVNLSKVAWNEADFQGSDFSDSDFSRGSVIKCNMADSNFHRVVAKNADFSKCNFSKASMVEANFFKGSLRKANLMEADLSRSNLYGVDFYNAVVEETLFDNANLKKTSLAQAYNE
jgi:uncharacterized protein YjbI with pentapeptide repeats